MAEKGLVELANGFWGYDVMVKGTRYKGNTGHKDKSLASEWLGDFKSKKRREFADLQLGIIPDPETTCKELLAEWIKHHTGDHVTRVKRDWENHINPTLGAVQAIKVTTAQVEEIRTAYLKGTSLRNVHQADEIAANKAKKVEILKKKGKYKEALELTQRPETKPRTNRSANKLMTHFNLVYSWAINTKRLPRRPYNPLDSLLEQDTVKTFLRPEQVEPFLKILDASEDLEKRIAIRVMLYLLLREKEALQLRWSGFDSEYKTYQAFNSKTGKVVPLPVRESLRVLLKIQRKNVDQSCEWVLPAEDGLPHRGQYTTKIIKKIGKQMGLSNISPHRMRGSGATLLARNGQNAFVIKKFGRWQRIETALKYVEIIEEDLLKASDATFGEAE